MKSYYSGREDICPECSHLMSKKNKGIVHFVAAICRMIHFLISKCVHMIIDLLVSVYPKNWAAAVGRLLLLNQSDPFCFHVGYYPIVWREQSI